jgi:hypothetical protein
MADGRRKEMNWEADGANMLVESLFIGAQEQCFSHPRSHVNNHVIYSESMETNRRNNSPAMWPVRESGKLCNEDKN